MKYIRQLYEEGIQKMLEEKEKERKDRENRDKKVKPQAQLPVEPPVEMRYKEKPHRFEVKDQKVLMRLRRWQKEMLYDDFTDTEP